MLLEGKLRRVALLAAVDICLKKMICSPKRCARNLIELGLSAYPDKLNNAEQNDLYKKLLTIFKSGNLPEAKALFITVFF